MRPYNNNTLTYRLWIWFPSRAQFPNTYKLNNLRIAVLSMFRSTFMIVEYQLNASYISTELSDFEEHFGIACEEVICMQNRFWGYLTNWDYVFQMHKVLDIAREIDHNPRHYSHIAITTINVTSSLPPYSHNSPSQILWLRWFRTIESPRIRAFIVTYSSSCHPKDDELLSLAWCCLTIVQPKCCHKFINHSNFTFASRFGYSHIEHLGIPPALKLTSRTQRNHQQMKQLTFHSMNVFRDNI